MKTIVSSRHFRLNDRNSQDVNFTSGCDTIGNWDDTDVRCFRLFKSSDNSSQLIFRCDKVFSDCIIMDEGAENNMDVPDSVSQRDDPVALEEDNAKLKI